MCKIFAAVGLTRRSYPKARRLQNALIPYMTAQGNDDGYGWMGVSPDRGVHGERWLDVSQAMRQRPSAQVALPDDLYFGVLSYNKFGRDPTGRGVRTALAAHSRLATCGVNMANVHPFYRDGYGFIHNGVVANSHALDLSGSKECDSMGIFNALLQHGATEEPEWFATALKEVSGSFACVLFTPHSVYVWRNGGSYLYASDIAGIGTVFTTVASDARAAASDAGLQVTGQALLREGNVLQFDAVSGALTNTFEFDASTHRATSAYWSRYVQSRAERQANASVEARHTVVSSSGAVLASRSHDPDFLAEASDEEMEAYLRAHMTDVDDVSDLRVDV